MALPSTSKPEPIAPLKAGGNGTARFTANWWNFVGVPSRVL